MAGKLPFSLSLRFSFGVDSWFCLLVAAIYVLLMIFRERWRLPSHITTMPLSGGWWMAATRLPSTIPLSTEACGRASCARSEEHTSELQSHRDLHSFPTRRSSDLTHHDYAALRGMVDGSHTPAIHHPPEHRGLRASLVRYSRMLVVRMVILEFWR